MIFTHLVLFNFFAGAGVASGVTTEDSEFHLRSSSATQIRYERVIEAGSAAYLKATESDTLYTK